jgi:hypothetical protein
MRKQQIKTDQADRRWVIFVGGKMATPSTRPISQEKKEKKKQKNAKISPKKNEPFHGG